MATINQTLQPGFTIRVQRGSNPVIPFTIYDRAGNVINLTGMTLYLAAKQTILVSNGLGQKFPKDFTIFNQLAVITGATLGNITIALSSAWTGLLGSFTASLRIWNNATINRVPDDAYDGIFTVADNVIKSEA